MGVKVTINDSLHEKLSQAKLKLTLEKALRQTMYDLMKEAMKEAPVDTGNLRRSHSIDVRLGGGMIEGLLQNSANYWQYVQFGTSRMEANDFVTRAFNTTAPAARTSEYFDKFYLGGG